MFIKILFFLFFSLFTLGAHAESFISELKRYASDFDEIEKQVRTDVLHLKRLKGKIKNSPKKLNVALELLSSARAKASVLAKFGYLLSTTSSESSIDDLYKRAVNLESFVEQQTPFIFDELNSFGKAFLLSEIKEEGQLFKHRRVILRHLDLRKMISHSKELVNASSYKYFNNISNSLYEKTISMIENWPMFEENGKSIEASLNNYNRIERDHDNNNKKIILKMFYDHINQRKDVFSEILLMRILSDQKYSESLNLVYSLDNLTVLKEGYEKNHHINFINSVKSNKSGFLKMMDILKAIRNKDSLSYSEVLNTRLKVEKPFPLDFASEILNDILRQPQKFDHSWINLSKELNPQNQVGVFWQVGDSGIHSLIPYSDNYISARTLVSSYLLKYGYSSIPVTNTPDIRENDFPIFSNAIWYLGRELFDKYTVEKHLSEIEIKNLLDYQITTIIRTIYLGTMLGEFELKINDKLSSGKPVLGSEVSEIYFELLKEYFSDIGILVPEYYKHEWVIKNQLYYDSSYFSWAMAYTAALIMVNEDNQDNSEFIKSILGGMSLSDAHYSSEVLELLNINFDSEHIKKALKTKAIWIERNHTKTNTPR